MDIFKPLSEGAHERDKGHRHDGGLSQLEIYLENEKKADRQIVGSLTPEGLKDLEKKPLEEQLRIHLENAQLAKEPGSLLVIPQDQPSWTELARITFLKILASDEFRDRTNLEISRDQIMRALVGMASSGAWDFRGVLKDQYRVSTESILESMIGLNGESSDFARDFYTKALLRGDSGPKSVGAINKSRAGQIGFIVQRKSIKELLFSDIRTILKGNIDHEHGKAFTWIGLEHGLHQSMRQEEFSEIAKGPDNPPGTRARRLYELAVSLVGQDSSESWSLRHRIFVFSKKLEHKETAAALKGLAYSLIGITNSDLAKDFRTDDITMEGVIKIQEDNIELLLQHINKARENLIQATEEYSLLLSQKDQALVARDQLRAARQKITEVRKNLEELETKFKEDLPKRKRRIQELKKVRQRRLPWALLMLASRVDEEASALREEYAKELGKDHPAYLASTFWLNTSEANRMLLEAATDPDPRFRPEDFFEHIEVYQILAALRATTNQKERTEILSLARSLGIEPEQIRTFDVAIGGKTKAELVKEIKQKKNEISPLAQSILDSKDFVTLPDKEAIRLVRLTVKDLGFPSGATTKQIFEKALSLGLELCPPEVGPHLRLRYQDQPLYEYLYVGMKQITDSDGRSFVFGLLRSGGGLWLDGGWAGPTGRWDPGDGFVFSLRK